jgi:hypothetical protein
MLIKGLIPWSRYADIPIMSASHVNPACVGTPRSSFTTIHLEEFQQGVGKPQALLVCNRSLPAQPLQL